MMSKEDCLAAIDKLETEMKSTFYGMGESPSRAGHNRELDQSILRLEESLMWMRRAIERMFS